MTKALSFMLQDRNPTDEQLMDAGGEMVGGFWVFPDGSRGRRMPMEGRFIALT